MGWLTVEWFQRRLSSVSTVSRSPEFDLDHEPTTAKPRNSRGNANAKKKKIINRQSKTKPKRKRSRWRRCESETEMQRNDAACWEQQSSGVDRKSTELPPDVFQSLLDPAQTTLRCVDKILTRGFRSVDEWTHRRRHGHGRRLSSDLEMNKLR